MKTILYINNEGYIFPYISNLFIATISCRV